MLYPCITYSPTTATKKEHDRKSLEESMASYKRGLKVKIIFGEGEDYEMSEETYEIVSSEADKNCPIVMITLKNDAGKQSLVSGEKIIDLEGYENFMKQLLLFVLGSENKQETLQYKN